MRREHTILVVDDHPATLYAASRWLQHSGFKTIESSSGEDAVNLSSQVSALLVDVNLPDMNGVAVCQSVRDRHPAAKKPIVLMSAVYTDELHRSAGLEAGADLYVMAPYDGDQLVAAFDRLLGTSRP